MPLLPLPDVTPKKLNACTLKTPGPQPWNVFKAAFPERMSIDEETDSLRIDYEKGKHGSSSGAALFGNPFKSLPAESATLSYDIFLPDTWDWRICGKFPGISFGLSEESHSSGGEWCDAKDPSGSFRLMWQNPENDGSALIKGYMYMAIPGGPMHAYKQQGPGFKEIGEGDDRTGCSAWYRKGDGKMRAHKGQWNSFAFTVKMNTIGKKDGFLKMTVNGVTHAVDDIVWRVDNPNIKIRGLYFVSIFGGSGMQFAPRHDTHCLIRNIHFDV